MGRRRRRKTRYRQFQRNLRGDAFHKFVRRDVFFWPCRFVVRFEGLVFERLLGDYAAKNKKEINTIPATLANQGLPTGVGSRTSSKMLQNSCLLKKRIRTNLTEELPTASRRSAAMSRELCVLTRTDFQGPTCSSEFRWCLPIFSV